MSQVAPREGTRPTAFCRLRPPNPARLHFRHIVYRGLRAQASVREGSVLIWCSVEPPARRSRLREPTLHGKLGHRVRGRCQGIPRQRTSVLPDCSSPARAGYPPGHAQWASANGSAIRHGRGWPARQRAEQKLETNAHALGFSNGDSRTREGRPGVSVLPLLQGEGNGRPRRRLRNRAPPGAAVRGGYRNHLGPRRVLDQTRPVLTAGLAVRTPRRGVRTSAEHLTEDWRMRLVTLRGGSNPHYGNAALTAATLSSTLSPTFCAVSSAKWGTK
jgi:hypothetical protein